MESSNTYVATVNSDGKIYAKSLGSTTISYRTYNNKTASFKLTVSGSAVKCLDISTWQGYVDFNKVKSAGYNYVILRAGFFNCAAKIKSHLCVVTVTHRRVFTAIY